VTFLFSDVEGSTGLWAADTESMSASLLVHDARVRDAIESHEGYVFATGGDSFAAAFTRASDAVGAAIAAQAALECADWPGPALKVRVGLHQGEAEERQGDYFGPVVNIAARVGAAGHGGQTVVTEAVRASARVADALDLGVHQLRDVDELLHLFQLGEQAFPPLRSVSSTPRSNLPVRPTRLIGRAAEVALVRQHLATHRLVTITAVGGSGKTRLAIAVGEDELDHRKDGVWFVDLTPVMNDLDVPAAIAAAIGLTLGPSSAQDQVLEYLAGKAALVILDNCEHLVDAVADFVEQFLARTGDTVILATSREALDIDGEQLRHLPSLATTDGASPAVRLFAERATAVEPRFALDGANTATIATICERLDGMPLAIELAAARITVMTPAELLAGLDDRFQLLSGGRRRQRQRTLEATLDWSYNLLEPKHQDVFRALGVFVGGFDLDAVAAVADIPRTAALDTIEALVAKSLVVRLDAPTAATRFALLETLKAYAEDRLIQTDEAARTRDRHADYYHQLTMILGRTLLPDARLGARLRVDRSNITSAIEWALLNNQLVRAGELLMGSYEAYDTDGHAAEAVGLYERCVGPLSDLDRELADYLRLGRMQSCITLEDWDAFFEIGAQLAASPDPRARCLANAGMAIPTALYFHDATVELHATAAADLAIARESVPGSATEAAAATFLFARSVHMAYSRDYRSALQLLVEGSPDLDAQHHVSTFDLTIRFDAAIYQILVGEPEAALRTLESLDLAQFAYAYGDHHDYRALAHLALGEHERAIEHLRAHAALAATGLRPRQSNDSVLILAALAHTEGDDDRARELLLDMGMGQTCATVAYSRELAERLAVGDEFRAREVFVTTPEALAEHGVLGSTTAARTLRNELARRGWS
jgi:predicted ATPase